MASKNPEGRWPTWPDDSTVEQVLTHFPDGWFKDRFLKDPGDKDKGDHDKGGKDQSEPAATARQDDRRGGDRRWDPHAFRRSVALSLLARSLLAEWQEEATKVLGPERIETAIKSLPEKEQNDLARRRPDELFRKAILGMIANPPKQDDGNAKPDGEAVRFAKDFAEVVKLRDRFDPFGRDGQGRGGPGFAFPPDGGPGRGGPGRGGPDFGGPGRGGPDRPGRGGPRHDDGRGRPEQGGRSEQGGSPDDRGQRDGRPVGSTPDRG
jgi:hypothetical protein